jgi:hypothetical protein
VKIRSDRRQRRERGRMRFAALAMIEFSDVTNSYAGKGVVRYAW